MKRFNSFSLILTFVCGITDSKPRSASLDTKTAEIPYQINNSDRIAIGIVSGINVYRPHDIYNYC